MGDNSDALLVGLLSVVGVLVSGIASVAVASITNRREKKSTAEVAAEDAADKATEKQIEAFETIIRMKDVYIENLIREVSRLEGEVARLESEVDRHSRGGDDGE